MMLPNAPQKAVLCADNLIKTEGGLVMDKKASQRGFTLLELVLVLGILTLAAGGIFSFYFLTGKTWNRSEENASYMNELRLLLAEIGDEIREASLVNASSSLLQLEMAENSQTYVVKYRISGSQLEKSKVLKNSPDNYRTILKNIYPLTDSSQQPLPFFTREGKKIIIRFKINNPDNKEALPLYVEETFSLRNKGV